MIKVNNFEQIESLLDFTSSDDFYFVQIIQRKKENPEISHHKSNRTRAIKSYDINSLELFRNKKSEIIELCKAFNARAYIHLTKRSYKKLAFQMQLNIAERCISGNYELMGRIFNTCCGITEVRVKPFNWVVDIDNIDTDVLAEYIKLIESIYVPADNESAIIGIIPTINGEHLITRPFNVHKFKQDLVINKLEDIDIHKNNPTLLYYEGSIKGEKDLTLCCENCGSQEVETLAWVDANTHEYREDFLLENPDNFCQNCQDHTDLILLKDYKNESDI